MEERHPKFRKWRDRIEIEVKDCRSRGEKRYPAGVRELTAGWRRRVTHAYGALGGRRESEISSPDSR